MNPSIPILCPIPCPMVRSEPVRTMDPQRRKGRRDAAEFFLKPSQSLNRGFAFRIGWSPGQKTQCSAETPRASRLCGSIVPFGTDRRSMKLVTSGALA